MIRTWAKVVGCPVVGKLLRKSPPWWEEVPDTVREYVDEAGTVFWVEDGKVTAATEDGRVF